LTFLRSSGDRCAVCARIHSTALCGSESGVGTGLLVGVLGTFGILDGSADSIAKRYARSAAHATIRQGDFDVRFGEAGAGAIQPGGHFGIVRALGDELVTGAVEHVLRTHFLGQRVGDQADGVIASGMAEGVVDALEVVGVEKRLRGLEFAAILGVRVGREVAHAHHRDTAHAAGGAVGFQQRDVLVAIRRRVLRAGLLEG
jgi:hypothetical protein